MVMGRTFCAVILSQLLILIGLGSDPKTTSKKEFRIFILAQSGEQHALDVPWDAWTCMGDIMYFARKAGFIESFSRLALESQELDVRTLLIDTRIRAGTVLREVPAKTFRIFILAQSGDRHALDVPVEGCTCIGGIMQLAREAGVIELFSCLALASQELDVRALLIDAEISAGTVLREVPKCGAWFCPNDHYDEETQTFDNGNRVVYQYKSQDRGVAVMAKNGMKQFKFKVLKGGKISFAFHTHRIVWKRPQRLPYQDMQAGDEIRIEIEDGKVFKFWLNDGQIWQDLVVPFIDRKAMREALMHYPLGIIALWNCNFEIDFGTVGVMVELMI